MRDKGFWWAYTLYVAAFIGDVASTYRVDSGVRGYLETNPLYRYGGFGAILALNAVLLVVYVWWYKKTNNPFLRYVLVWGMIMTVLVRVGVIINNWGVGTTPPTIQQAMTITQQTKNAYHLKTTLLVNISPLLQVLFTYLFWSKDHDIRRKQDEE